ncbi:hydroxymethylbilane synthase, partial [Pseudomonas sp. MPR-R2A7]
LRPDLNFAPLVGNVDSRLRRLIAREYDAIVLAEAGLIRLGLIEAWSQSEFGSLVVHRLSLDQMLPAPGQAVLVLETRSDDHPVIEAIRPLHD